MTAPRLRPGGPITVRAGGRTVGQAWQSGSKRPGVKVAAISSLRLVALAASVVLALAIAPAASASVFTVDSAGDQADSDTTDGACLTGAGTCTFRAAVQQSNAAASPGADTVRFGSAVAGSTIEIGSGLTVNDTLDIEGCSSNASSTKPCVGVTGPKGDLDKNGLTVRADDVIVKGISFTHLGEAIFYSANNAGLIVRNCWFGLRLDETADANSKGIQLEGARAKIGGTTQLQRNLFGNGGIGISIFGGAHDNLVQGNFFGTQPNGIDPAPLTKPIEIVGNGVGATPSNNTIGGTLSTAAASTPECDGACNVVGSAAPPPAIDLGGSSPGTASGPVTIRGNFIGVNANGTSTLANSNQGGGVGVRQASGVVIGGPSPLDRNVFGGHNTGLSGGGDGPLLVRNNFFGLRSDGASALPEPGDGTFITSAAGAVATVRENRWGGQSGNGLTLFGTSAKVVGNVFGVGTGGQIVGFGMSAIWVTGAGHTIGGSGAGNVIAGAGSTAVVLNGADNTMVQGNFIGQDASGNVLGNKGAGIRLEQDADNNVIGGATAALENAISNNTARPAIAILHALASGNLIARNHGAGNSLFIDLGANGIGNGVTGPNGGAQAPAITGASTTAASGTAPAGATVRVFRVGATLGTVHGFVGQTTANGSGNWTLAYGSPLPAGTRISATQTVANNTSELTSPSLVVE